MKLFQKSKDGGPESTVTGYFLCEFKSLFSIVLLKFEGKSREAYHSHAFNCFSWVLRGKLVEDVPVLRDQSDCVVNTYRPSIFPFVIRRSRFHKVDSIGTTWVLSVRGPWAKTWMEYLPDEDRYVVLTSGRREV